jgi:hypothetical protein
VINSKEPILISSMAISSINDTMVLGGKRIIYYSTEAVTF